ncbi:MAG: hypothetical protein N4A57_17475 [Anaeromicrobium sp.]|jgi:hypothetical protein|uniref:hypothetical protein n=1 Tax=Anaeromicrobium sp. TaxID=1929132 RepID=UPI0025DD57F0|nr:hypothetical protein [Anaeromicrobium sp.]MCT4596041.1 hypothetical protein [Anaeromicrobium sp.]
MIRKKYIAAILFISVTLSVATNIAPIFFSLPKWIYLNIVGTFLISYSFGPIIGGIYAGLLNLGLNSVGMGSGIIIYVLLTQIVEAGLIGLLRIKRMQGVLNTLLIGFLLSIVIKPVSITFYNVFNGEMDGFMNNLSSMYFQYYKTGFTSNLVTYLISAITAYAIYEGINKFIMKRKEEIIL